jgi:hypothetical protein
VRVYKKRYGNSPNAKGYAIFWMMLIFLPVVGCIFGLVNFIIQHLVGIIFGGIIILGLISYICFKISDKNEEENEEC